MDTSSSTPCAKKWTEGDLLQEILADEILTQTEVKDNDSVGNDHPTHPGGFSLKACLLLPSAGETSHETPAEMDRDSLAASLADTYRKVRESGDIRLSPADRAVLREWQARGDQELTETEWWDRGWYY